MNKRTTNWVTAGTVIGLIVGTVIGMFVMAWSMRYNDSCLNYCPVELAGTHDSFQWMLDSMTPKCGGLGLYLFEKDGGWFAKHQVCVGDRCGDYVDTPIEECLK